MSQISTAPLSHRVPVGNVSRQGKTVRLEATETERAAIAAECGLPELSHLEAEFTVSKGAGRLLAVQGRVSATVTQSCGVTLKPVEEEVEAEVVLTYTLDPEAMMAEVEVHPEDDDPPEPVIDGQIDFGALALEHFALNLNPYPRAPGVAFESSAWQDDPDGDHKNEKKNPFAILESIKAPVNDP